MIHHLVLFAAKALTEYNDEAYYSGSPTHTKLQELAQQLYAVAEALKDMNI